MFTTTTWSQYALTVLLLLFVWYSYLIFRFYSTKLKAIFTARPKVGFSGRIENKNSLEDNLFWEFKDSLQTLQEARELFYKLKNAFLESQRESRGRDEFKNYIKFILEQYPYIKNSALRSRINNLTVCLCENSTGLSLTYAEVDDLWQEAV